MILSFDFVEFYVSNLPVFKFLLKQGLDFEDIKTEYLADSEIYTTWLLQNSIKLRCTSSSDNTGELLKEVKKSGDFIKDVAFQVDDIERIVSNATAYGAIVLEPIKEVLSENGMIKKAVIKSYGNCQHTLIQNLNKSSCAINSTGNAYLKQIDHIAVAVEASNLERWTGFYENIFGLTKIFEENVTTEFSGMNSVVMGNVQNEVRIVLVSPVNGKNKSQISDFISNNNGEGIQHLAFSTESIFEAVKQLKDKGLEFLEVNDEYYENLKTSYDGDICLRDLKDLQILYDNDDFGELLQIFSKKMHTRLTWFIEVIERRGAKTFGRGNVKKLYESIEKELKNTYERK